MTVPKLGYLHISVNGENGDSFHIKPTYKLIQKHIGFRLPNLGDTTVSNPAKLNKQKRYACKLYQC